MHQIDFVHDHLQHTKKLLVNNTEPPELSLSAYI